MLQRVVPAGHQDVKWRGEHSVAQGYQSRRPQMM